MTEDNSRSNPNTLSETFRLNLAFAIKGYSRKVVAHRSGYSETYTRRVIKGQQIPTLSYVSAMAGALEVPVLSLLGGNYE
jgi:transcriptional regulator with XRE-family HTH domain